jgi:L-iditol 2-dehydrogenase
MKALVLDEYNTFVYKDVPEPKCCDDEVLIQVKACGICGSDVHGMDGSTGRRIPPIIMGHEASGVIVETGSDVKGFTKGDRVTFDSTVYCGKCHFCKMGRINLCNNRKVLGVSCDDYRRDGAFAQYIAVPERILYRLPEKVTFEQAAMVEPLSIALHAVRLTPISLSDTAVVVGAGMIGLLVVQALRAAGCGWIIAVDLDPWRLELAAKLGANTSLRSDQIDILAEIQELTKGIGADIAFEAVGIGSTVNMAAASLRKGGNLTLIGNVTPAIEFPLQTIVTREIAVRGSCASNGEYPACLDMIASGAVNVDALMSQSAPLCEGARWFKKLYERNEKLMKVLLTP